MKFLNDKYFWIVLLLTLSVRIYIGFFTYVIQNDSIAFMQNAQYFANGDFLSGLRHDYHPLYSLFIAGLYKIVQNIELSGTIISVFFGTFTVMIFYTIGRRIFDQKITFVSSIILAFHPYAVRFSADIISESTYFFFFTSALGLGFFAITNGRFLLFALAGISAAFAYLVRPEGIGIILIVFCWCLFKDFVKLKTFWRKRLVSVLVLVVSFLAISSPYLIYIKKETGVWQITKKKKLSEMVGVEKILAPPGNESFLPDNGDYHLSPSSLSTPLMSIQPHPGENGVSNMNISEAVWRDDKVMATKPEEIPQNIGQLQNYELNGRNVNEKEKLNIDTSKQYIGGKIDLKTHIKSISYVIGKYFDTFHPFLFVFLVIGVISWKRAKRENYFGLYITSIIVFYLLILYRLNITHITEYGVIDQYPSRRHLMPIIIPALFCVGVGINAVINWVQERLQTCRPRSGFRKLSMHEWIIYLIMLMVVVGVLLPKTLKSQRYDKIGIKNAGQWLKENSDNPLPVVLSSTPRSAYYAGGRHIQLRNIDNIISEAIAEKPDYVLVTHKEYRTIEKEMQQLVKSKQIILIYKYPEKASSNENNIFLYKVLY